MNTRPDALALGEALLGGLLAAIAAVLALSWILGRRHRAYGDSQAPPSAGTIAPEQHHQSPPGR
jgi:hypothetical protein